MFWFQEGDKGHVRERIELKALQEVKFGRITYEEKI